jgi:mRNA interferase MazF
VGRHPDRRSRLSPRRGDTWLVDLGDPLGREPAGQRPALVVSDDLWNEGPAGVVVVVPITTVGRGLRTQVEIDDRLSGLDEVSYARCEDIRSVSTQRLVAPLGRVADLDMIRVERVLRVLLGL